eukprot:112812_1
MGKSPSKPTEPKTKKKIPSKYKCPIAKRIMVNPVCVVASGRIYDQMSITKWLESKRPYDPITAVPFVSLLTTKCDGLQAQIQTFCTQNGYDKNDGLMVNENLNWNALFQACDRKIRQKIIDYERLKTSLRTKAIPLLFTDKNDTKNMQWNESLLLLLITSDIPIFTFIGASREGKSTLLNDIIGISNVFGVSNSPDIAQTKGAWAALCINDETEEEKVTNAVYDDSFFLIDMEGLTNQFTEFTEKVFYAVYAFSNVVIWNDKKIGSDHFHMLMTKLQKTMSTVSIATEKPSFLYLHRDKDDFLEFGTLQTFNRYINESNKSDFKSFRELELFSSIHGYEIIKRPSKTKPFPPHELQNLIRTIFNANQTGKRFIPHYAQLQTQLDHINKCGVLSLGMQYILAHEVLQWFVDDDTNKWLLYAQEMEFDAQKIEKAFVAAIKDSGFVYMEQNGVIDAELKQQLLQNKDVMIECILHRHDELSDNNKTARVVGAVPTIIVANVLNVVPSIPAIMIDGIAGWFGKKPHALDTVVKGSVNAGLVLGVPFYYLTKGFSKMGGKVNETVKRSSNPNYCRYKLTDQDSFVVKHKLMEKTAIPLFVESEESNNILMYDHHLLNLISSNLPIICCITSASNAMNSEINKVLNDVLESNLFSQSNDTSPVITKQQNMYIVKMTWANTPESKRMFYSLYCLSNVVVWIEDEDQSSDFEAFNSSLAEDLIWCAPHAKRKPSFILLLCHSHQNIMHLQTFNEAHVFKEAHTLDYNRADLKSVLSTAIQKNNERFCCFQPYQIWEYQKWIPRTNEHDNMCCKCCSQELDVATSPAQCVYCGDLQFKVPPYFVHPLTQLRKPAVLYAIPLFCNEYIFYRQLLYIHKHGKLSLTLQRILEHEALRYFVFDADDRYRERRMWYFAKSHRFDKDMVCKTFDDAMVSELGTEQGPFAEFENELQKGKEEFIYALSSTTEKWRGSSITLNQNEIETESDLKEEEEEDQTKNDDSRTKHHKEIVAQLSGFGFTDDHIKEALAMYEQSHGKESKDYNIEMIVDIIIGLQTKQSVDTQGKDEAQHEENKSHKNENELDDDLKQHEEPTKQIQVNMIAANEDQIRNAFKEWFFNIRFGSKTQDYYAKMIDLGYDDFETIIELEENDLDEIGMKKPHQKKFKKKLGDLKGRMKRFMEWMKQQGMEYYMDAMTNNGVVTFQIFYDRFHKYQDILPVIGSQNVKDAKMLWNNSPKNVLDQQQLQQYNDEGIGTPYVDAAR